MRIAPLAFCLDLRSAEDRRTLREVCSITHKHDEAYSGALAVALAIQEGLHEGALLTTLLRSVAEQLPDTSTRDALLELDRLEVDAPIASAATQCGTSGYAAESVPLALFAARRARLLAVPEVLAEVVAVGGDTDTIASMAGQVAGAALSEKALPEEWAKKVPERESVLRTAQAFSEVLLG